jgi:hypothetical protein
MNNLYHKVAVASVCTALGFVLGASSEAKAASFTLTATKFFIDDIYPQDNYGADGVGDTLLNSRYDNELFEFVLPDIYRFPTVAKEGIERRIERERRAFYEFNIGSLSLAPNTVIRSAIFQQRIEEARRTTGANRFRALILEIFGYVGNGRPDLSDFGAGVSLGREDAVGRSDPKPYYGYPYNYYTNYNGGILRFDVTQFVDERVSNRDAFAGFGIRVYEDSFLAQIGFPNRGVTTLSDSPYLTIETVDAESVPEPATIFGSALALGVGGWLKRKKSSQQNKTTPHH